MGDEQIEELIRRLIEMNLDQETQTSALEWLERLTINYRAMEELGLIKKPQPPAVMKELNRRPTSKTRAKKSAKRSKPKGSSSNSM